MTQLCLPSYSCVTWETCITLCGHVPMQTQKVVREAGSGACAAMVRRPVQASRSVRRTCFPVLKPILLCVPAVVLSNRHQGSRKPHRVSRLLLLTQSANNTLTYSHEVLLRCSSHADVSHPASSDTTSHFNVCLIDSELHWRFHRDLFAVFCLSKELILVILMSMNLHLYCFNFMYFALCIALCMHDVKEITPLK